MRAFPMILKVASVSLIAFQSANSWAWGQYGHQVINLTAIKLAGGQQEIGRCMAQAPHLVKRLASTPDIEWKSNIDLSEKLSDESLQKRREDDQYEHSLHFFETDAYTTNNTNVAEIRSLPSGEFTAGFAQYRELFKKNISRILSMDPGKKIQDPANPSVNDITGHGTAPWRALQLYRLGVRALKAGDVKLALLYLGTMGHYVGDLSQPFHTTLNFDGQFPGDARTAGIHSEIDTKLLPGKKKGSKDEFSVFDEEFIESTLGPVILEKAKGLAAANLENGEQQLVPSLMAIIADGSAAIKPLLNVYAKFCKIRNERAEEENVEKRYCEVDNSGGRPRSNPIGAELERAMAGELLEARAISVSDFINSRLATSASLLAQLWISAHKAAGSPALGDCTRFGDSGEFNGEFQAYAISNFPRPNDPAAFGYMPPGYEIERPHDDHTGDDDDL